MTDLIIDKMRMEDLDEVMEIERESFSMPWSRWMFEKELEYKGHSYFLVARKEGEVVGYIGFWLVVDEAHIVTIAVRSEFRRMGIGSMLMASALTLAVQLSARNATLEVRVTNIPAQELYDKFGFQVMAIRKNFYSDTGEDAYVMWLPDLKDKIGQVRAYMWKMQTRKEKEV